MLYLNSLLPRSRYWSVGLNVEFTSAQQPTTHQLAPAARTPPSCDINTRWRRSPAANAAEDRCCVAAPRIQSGSVNSSQRNPLLRSSASLVSSRDQRSQIHTATQPPFLCSLARRAQARIETLSGGKERMKRKQTNKERINTPVVPLFHQIWKRYGLGRKNVPFIKR